MIKPQVVLVSMMVGIYFIVLLGFREVNLFSLSGNSLSKEVQQMNELEQSGIDEAMIIHYMVSDTGVQTAHDPKSAEIIDYLISSGIDYESIAEEL